MKKNIRKKDWLGKPPVQPTRLGPLSEAISKLGEELRGVKSPHEKREKQLNKLAKTLDEEKK